MTMLMQRYSIPQGVDTNNPNAILQHLLNTGQVSQQQVNTLQGMRNNPAIQQMINKK
jgi:hypothetical protein